MKIAITGVTGFIGQEICNYLSHSSHEVIGFSRHPSREKESVHEWRDLKGGFSDCDAVIHLAGESIIGWWNEAKRRRIWQSRVELTRKIVDSLAKGGGATKCLVTASAVGYYGDCGEGLCTEDSRAGCGFFSELCRVWEAESSRAEEYEIRTVQLRIGAVLGKNGGAIPLMKPIFRLGLGGRLGSGLQWMSCVHVSDVAKLAVFCIEQSNMRGAVNAVMPEPIRNSEFTQEMGRILHRLTPLPVPAFALRLGLGDLSHVFLDSQRVVPQRALQSGYPFNYSTVPDALRDVL